MGHVANIADSLFAGILLIALTAGFGYVIKTVKSSGIARTLVRFLWSAFLLSTTIFFIYAAYDVQHMRGFNNGVAFVVYIISTPIQFLRFILFNSNWIGSFANKTKTVWKHMLELASPDYSSENSSSQKRLTLEQAMIQLEEADYLTLASFKLAEELKRIGPDAVSPLIEALDHSRINVRNNAAHALGLLRDERAIGPLINKFTDSDTSITASQALAEYGRPAIHKLSEAARDERRTVRDGAITALGFCKDKRAIEVLQELFAEWLDERQKTGKNLCELSTKIIENYRPSLFLNVSSEQQNELLKQRSSETLDLKQRVNSYFGFGDWWQGRNIAQAVARIAEKSLRQDD